MTLVLLVPLLLLAAACIVLFGRRGSEYARMKLAAYPVGAAFLGAAATLYHVTTEGPVSIRFYDLSSVASFAIPFGFYVDRLSAVMMTLITGVSVIIYTYSTGYMYQDRHARRYRLPQRPRSRAHRRTNTDRRGSHNRRRRRARPRTCDDDLGRRQGNRDRRLPRLKSQ